MDERVWKLYKEVRRLRRKVKTLEADCGEANYKFNIAMQEIHQWRQLYEDDTRRKELQPYDRLAIMIPNMYGCEFVQDPRYADTGLRAEHLMKRLTETAKIKIADDLIQRGYLRKVRGDEMFEVYEIKVVR